MDKLAAVDFQADDGFEDFIDDEEERGARGGGAGRRYSHWAGQARARRKRVAARERGGGLTRE
jgi:hypothetical protein